MRLPTPRLVAAAAVAAVTLGCGMKGPPLAPIQIVATAITDLTARRLGSTVYLQFTIPQRNVIGDGPADIERVEVYGFTGEPVETGVTPLDDEDFLDLATLVASLDVQPPPPPIEEGAEPDLDALPPIGLLDDRPVQGAILLFTDELTPEAMEPVEVDSRDDDEEPQLIVLPSYWPSTDPALSRYYVAVARNRRNQASAATTRVRIPLDPPPPPPTSVVAHYSAANIALSWQAPDGAPALVQQPPTAVPAAPAGTTPPPPPLSATPIVQQRTLYTYNVYDPGAIPNSVGLVAPINPAPLATLTFSDTRVTFGAERCYVVHTVDTYGTIRAESEPSEPICVTPVDTFRPLPPTRLVAVGSQGAISLLWEPSAETDLAGYVVLRGEASAEELQPLTPTPIDESTYRDTSVVSGVTYVYAVIAVDDATPPNVSLESNRVQETAR